MNNLVEDLGQLCFLVLHFGVQIFIPGRDVRERLIVSKGRMFALKLV